ncbi:MAG TPA: sugar ABC transporter permease [Candidatus Dormibacteraeota bacterium]|nr:sugar ABC transporter permease [Candidatus Dormibacteraeota bacterium]
MATRVREAMGARIAGVRPAARIEGRAGEAYLFLAPALAILLVFVVLPAIWIFVLSLYRWDLISSDASFIGAGNYQRMEHDPLWWKSLWQTCYFVAVTVPVGTALALALAMLLNTRIRGRSIFRAAVFAPYVTPAVATIVIWQWIFNHDYGLLNSVLVLFHLPKIAWLIDSNTIMPSVIIYSLWATVGFNVVIFLAGLANIPPDLQEAARVDGASAWQVFRRVTWPLLSPTTYFVLLISSIGSFKVFNVVYVLTESDAGVTGGPDRAALTIGVYLYKQAFEFFRAGYASAISVALFAIILAVTVIQMRVASRRVFYR